MSSRSEQLLRRRICVHYPEGPGRMVMTTDHVGDVYPHFDGTEHGSLSEPLEFDSAILGRRHRIRVYLPAGYAENTVQRYPVLYMQDGKNLFFPEEAFAGREWKVDKSLQLLDSTSLVEHLLVVGIHSGEREHEYTQPGYEAYARSVVEEVRPVIARELRILDSPRETSVLGSSLGGVVSFYMAWQYPHVFGYAACMSSTFSYRDDLIERVLSEPMSPAKFYLDSGWPHDNYEVTLATFHRRPPQGSPSSSRRPNTRHSQATPAAGQAPRPPLGYRRHRAQEFRRFLDTEVGRRRQPTRSSRPSVTCVSASLTQDTSSGRRRFWSPHSASC